MYVHVSYIAPFDDKLKEELDEKFQEYHQSVTNGFIQGLRTTKDQLLAVFDREGARCVDIAFNIVVYEDKFATEIFAYPFDNVTDAPPILFPLTPLNGMDVCFDFSSILKGKIHAGSGFTMAWNAARRLAADFGREGVPKKMKPIIAELGKFLKKGSQFSNCANSNWVKVQE